MILHLLLGPHGDGVQVGALWVVISSSRAIRE
jgi:hypothetical protein